MQGGQKESGELEIIWVVVGILLFSGAIFFIFQKEILTGILWAKYIELKIISYFVVNDNYSGLANWVHRTGSNKIKFLELKLLSLEVGKTLQYPCMVFTALLAALLFWKHPDSGYRDIENMKSLTQKIQKTFPAINVVSGINLISASVDEGPWAMALTPIEFAKKYKLLERDAVTQAVVIDQNKAKLIFTHQLGEIWPGLDKLKPYEKALFAIFAAFANFKRDEAERKMEEIVASLSPDQLKSGRIRFNTDILFKKYKDTPVIKRILGAHAFTYTIFIELLSEARKSGIVLNSLSLWLKPIDRKLWYVLNNVGRKAVYTEAGAAQAHWLAEKKLGFAIRQPMVDEAISALEEAVHNRIIRDI